MSALTISLKNVTLVFLGLGSGDPPAWASSQTDIGIGLAETKGKIDRSRIDIPIITQIRPMMFDMLCRYISNLSASNIQSLVGTGSIIGPGRSSSPFSASPV